MPIVDAKDKLNPHAFIDTDHPERGVFIGKAGMDTKTVAAEWDAVLRPTAEQQALDEEKAEIAKRDGRDRARAALKDELRTILAELLDERKTGKP